MRSAFFALVQADQFSNVAFTEYLFTLLIFVFEYLLDVNLVPNSEVFSLGISGELEYPGNWPGAPTGYIGGKHLNFAVEPD